MILASLALMAAAPEPGAITIRYGFWGAITTIRIAPDGVLTVRRTKPKAAPEIRRIDTGPTGYRRIAELLAPTRRWAGGAVPCTTGSTGTPPADIRWEADGAKVHVPLSCWNGPADHEPELVRAAMDTVKTWERDAATTAATPPPKED